jgi:hypothetical protein
VANKPTNHDLALWEANQARPCNRCGVTKPFSDFHPSTRSRLGVNPACKVCHNADSYKYQKKRRAEGREARSKRDSGAYIRNLREKAIEILGGSCLDCGFADSRALQFDHKTPIGKQRPSLSSLYCAIIRGENPGVVIRCANCHVIKTRRNGDYSKTTIKKKESTEFQIKFCFD